MNLDHAPQYAFGIRHSPYLGKLKGEEWVSARTEVITPPNENGHTSESSQTVKTMVNGGSTTTTTRTHSDGHRIRTETFSYTKGPVTKITTTTTSMAQAVA